MESSFIENIISKDEQLLIYLNNLGIEQWDGFWLFMTSKYTSVLLYLILLFFFYKRFGLKRTVVFSLLVIVLVTASDQTANLFKNGFERLRPCHQEGVRDFIRLVKSTCGGKFSYFSAHASTGMGLAVFFACVFAFVKKRLKYMLLLFAVLVGYSRIYLGVHYPLDVLTGFVFGLVYGLFFFKVYKSIERRIVLKE